MCSLEDPAEVGTALNEHLLGMHQEISGITCFDCESLELASTLAENMSLPYPKIQAIRNTRNKYVSKQLWQAEGVPCPKTILVNEAEDAVRFLETTGNGVVLKPFYGSGSELVFRCRTREECEQAYLMIRQGIEDRSDSRQFKQNSPIAALMLAEEMINGPEFSCDFIVENNTIRIIRMTSKIKHANKPFGTVTGYLLTSRLPVFADDRELERILLKGAAALGIERSICMVDFIYQGGRPKLIEMTPRPGGDCLPFLLKEAANLDILKLTLDFSEQKPMDFNGFSAFKPWIGIRIHASKSGILRRINTDQLKADKRIKQIHLIRQPGHVITMPPKDYDSWFLGHLIVEPDKNTCPETQSLIISKRLNIEIE